jgi:glycosyltransferase involved in cell wall biosynthesis
MSWSTLQIPRRVLMTADTIGGVWTYSIQLCRALADFNVQVTLATMGRQPSPSQLSEVAGLANTQIISSEYKLEWMDDPWSDVERSRVWLARLGERIQPDLVHLNTYAHGSIPWNAPVLMVGHSCVFSWWHAVRNESPPAELNRYREEVEQGLRGADKVIAPSIAMLDELNRIYGPLKNGQVIANGSDRALTNPIAKENLVLSAGRIWDEAKNVRVLAQVAADLKWPVIVAGDCGENQPRGVRCLGELPREQLAFWQNKAAIYAAPAKYEPFGLSVLEAATSACALVLGDIPSLRENWEGAAEFVDPTNTGALTNVLNALADDPLRRQSLGFAARTRASELTLDRMVEDYLTAYSELLTIRNPVAFA